jgi:hypothetical protein
MEILTIHSIKKEYFDLPLDDYHLNFDDGLFSQYYYFPLLRRHKHELLYFISSAFIRPGPARKMFTGIDIPYRKSKKYMHQALMENNYDDFMRIEELQELARTKGVRIGLHSHFHDIIPTRTHAQKQKPLSQWKLDHIGYPANSEAPHFSIRSKLAFQGFYYRDGKLIRRSKSDWLDFIQYDTETALQWFETHLGFVPDTYCFPFGEHNQMLIDILKTYGLKCFYSARPGPCPEIQGRIDIDSLMIQDT